MAWQEIKETFADIKERPFDKYILGGFLIWYGIKSKSMPKLSRRLLVSAGIWRIYYSWSTYQKIGAEIAELLSPTPKSPLTSIPVPQTLNTSGITPEKNIVLQNVLQVIPSEYRTQVETYVPEGLDLSDITSLFDNG